MDGLFDLSDRTAVVTGGSRGIGLMAARGLLQAGATVVISSRNTQACEEACAELAELGQVSSIPADLSTEAECRRLADAVRSRHGGIDILINNAGATWGEPLATYPASAWDKVIDLNLKSPFFLVQAFLSDLESSSSPDHPSAVINIGSIDGLSVPGMPTYAYSASKAGLHHLTRVLAAEIGSRGITCNTIAPGPFRSKMMEKTLSDHEDTFLAKSPMGRIGEPDDVAGAVIYLASRAGSYVTGALLTLDGGLNLSR